MTLEVFSEGWAARCAEAIRCSASYRETAATWEGDLVFVMSVATGGADRAVYFDLWHGECRGARVATETDRAAARYVIEGSEETWVQALNGRLPLLLAVMTGRFRLTRGALMDFAPYAFAARDLLAAVSAVGETSPES
jgi:putative sterol carrier protein